MNDLVFFNDSYNRRKEDDISMYQSRGSLLTFSASFLKKEKTIKKETSSGLNGNKEFRSDL